MKQPTDYSAGLPGTLRAERNLLHALAAQYRKRGYMLFAVGLIAGLFIGKLL